MTAGTNPPFFGDAESVREGFRRMGELLMTRAREHNVSWDNWTPKEMLSAVTAEVGEAYNALRAANGDPRKLWYSESGKPEGFGPEGADIIIAVVAMQIVCGLDPFAELDRKLQFRQQVGWPKRKEGE